MVSFTLVDTLSHATSKNVLFERTPLWWSPEHENEEIVKLNLANDDIDVNARDPLHGEMLIWLSLSNGYAGVIMLSLEKETLDVDLQNTYYRRTPLG
jgi:hypothetical protein